MATVISVTTAPFADPRVGPPVPAGLGDSNVEQLTERGLAQDHPTRFRRR